MNPEKLLSLLSAAMITVLLTACAGSSSPSPSSDPGARQDKGTAASSAKGNDETLKTSDTEGNDENMKAPADTEGGGEKGKAAADTGAESVEIQVFIAASLNTVMQDIAAAFNKIHPEVSIVYNADSSGTLLTQIEEGYECDVFFSAAQKQMDALEKEDGLVVDGTRHNVVNNQVTVITLKDSQTAVTGLSDIGSSSSIALADGSVPVGRYTRKAMTALGLLPERDDPSAWTTREISDALGGVEISEQSNVSKVLAAVVEGSCEVGTTYYSDTYGYEDQLEILERVPYELTGNVIYPIAQVKNPEASDAQAAAAREFVNFVISDEAKDIFSSYYFDTDVEQQAE